MNQKSRNKELEIGGISFGITSGVITTIGMIVGLDAATGSRLAIIAGILTVAICDSLSDAVGIHLSEESRLDETSKPIWLISLFTFMGKLVFSLIFVIPFILMEKEAAKYFCIIIGIVLIVLLSYFVAKRRKSNILKEMFVQIALTITVIIISSLVGTILDRIIVE